jgi:hypothetical protein
VQGAAVRQRRSRPLKTIALLLNLVMFGIGLYFEVHPRDRQDAWSAAGVAAVALLNSAALTIPPSGSEATRRLVHRLRRIDRYANLLLFSIAVAILTFELLNDWTHALLHGTALVLPPLFTLLALREQARP